MSSILEIKGLKKSYSSRAGRIWAVDGVNLSVEEGECLGLVGESGSGKSTLCGIIAKLSRPDSGSIFFEGKDIAQTSVRSFSSTPERALLQIVFQDPRNSLNPRHSVFQSISEPLIRMRLSGSRTETRNRVHELMELTGLHIDLVDRLPHQLSGGQLARVAISRALAPGPKLLILDEPTAALDVSIQSKILKLLDKLRRELGTSLIFVSHDLGVLRLISDRIVVMYSGKIVEIGAKNAVLDYPLHPYSQALVSALPMHGGKRIMLKGESKRRFLSDESKKCIFFERCSKRMDSCNRIRPDLLFSKSNHAVACHLVHGDDQPKDEAADS